MADFIQFTGPIKPLGSSKFSLLEDKFLKGGFRVVDKKAELANLDASTIKKGMLVAVNEEDGAIYECIDFSETVDEFGDPIVSSNFQPFAADASSGSGQNAVYTRPTKTITYTYVNAGQVASIPVNLGCQSFVLTALEVPIGRKLKVRIYTSAAKIDPIVFEFNSIKKNFLDGSTYLKNNTRFQYKKFFTFVNKEVSAAQKRTFIFECESIEDSAYSTSHGSSYQSVDIKISYIPLET
jgi:hypothetical protein